MDHHLKKAAVMGEGSGDGYWTEERHASFLNTIEQSFVNTMLIAGAFDRSNAISNPALRLDRYLPDSATESTRDMQSNNNNSRAAAASSMDPGTRNLAARNQNITKKRLLPQRKYDESQDQVVPEKDNAPKSKKGGKQVSRWL